MERVFLEIMARLSIDDSSVSSNVPVFVLSDDDRAMAAFSLLNGIGRSCDGCDNANDSTIFPIFLSVSNMSGGLYARSEFLDQVSAQGPNVYQLIFLKYLLLNIHQEGVCRLLTSNS